MEKQQGKTKIKRILVLSLFPVALLVVISAVVLSNRHDRDAEAADFAGLYAKYAEAAKDHEMAAYLPGAAANPVRSRLDRALTTILTGEIDAAERMKISSSAMDLAEELESQIDDIGDKRNSTEKELSRLENFSMVVENKELAGEISEIVEVAKDKAEIIADLRGLSYSINGETKEIIKQIIADKGVLTDAHVNELNRRVPENEERFDRRRELYQRLSDLSDQMEEKYNEF